MPVQELTQQNINETIESNDIVIIDFWAPWCAPCQTFKPIFHDAAERHPEAAFVSCNTEEQQELAAMFQIRSIPTIMVFRERIGIFSQPGMLPAEGLDQLMEKVKELDMDDVRRQIAAEDSGAGAQGPAA
jgi:thioredoxin